MLPYGADPGAETLWFVTIGLLVALAAGVLFFAVWYERRPLE